ncbi:unnamed protein product [Prunus armeniaca]
MTAVKKRRGSSARAKGSSAKDPKVDKPSPAKDAGVSNLLKKNFLSSPSTCAQLVDQIRQASDLAPSWISRLLKSPGESKFEATMDAYKLCCLDCKNGFAPLYAIGDEDIEEFCPDLLHVRSEQVNAANMEGVEEQTAEEAVTEEGGADEDEADEIWTDFVDQAGGAAKSVAD